MRAIIRDHIVWWRQLLFMSLIDLKREYRSASLGWLWAVIKPGFMIFVYWFIIKVGLKANIREGFNEVSFLAWLSVGLVVWFFINDAIRDTMGSMRKYSYLITKMKFPVNIIPTFTIISNFIVHMVLFAIAMVSVMIQYNYYSWQWIQIPYFMLMSLAFLWCWGQITAPLAAISKDFQSLVNSLIQGLFWFSGVLFDVNAVSSTTLRYLLKINPVTYLIEGYRSSIFFHEWIAARPVQTAVFLGELVLLFVLSVVVGRNTRNELADVL